MQRFFVTFPLSIDIRLTDSLIISQITRVLRMQEGDHVILFDGDGSETEYEIQAIEKKSISLRGIGRKNPNTEQKKSITLYQGMPNKYEKIEYILQKGIEIGIQRFVFFRSDRSQKLLISDSKTVRFFTIAREALEQCGGLKMPEIEFLDKNISLESEKARASHQIVLDTSGPTIQVSELDGLQDIGIWVGPEGGWGDEERVKMRDNGFIFARFGERIMRTETAGVALAFAIFHL